MPKKAGYKQVNVITLTGPVSMKETRVPIKTLGYKTYFNCQHLMLKLKPLEHSFLVYLIEQSEHDNRILVDTDIKNGFISFLTDITKKDPGLKPNNLDKMLKRLVELGLILHDKNTRGYYLVNPKYFWKESEKKRLVFLEKLIHNRILDGLPVDKLIDIPLQELLKT